MQRASLLLLLILTVVSFSHANPTSPEDAGVNNYSVIIGDKLSASWEVIGTPNNYVVYVKESSKPLYNLAGFTKNTTMQELIVDQDEFDIDIFVNAYDSNGEFIDTSGDINNKVYFRFFVAEDGAWPTVSLKSEMSFNHTISLQIPYLDFQFDLEAPTSQVQEELGLPLEVIVNENDNFDVKIVVYNTSTTDSLLFYDEPVTVRRGGGAGVSLSPVVALEDEPGTGWTVTGSSDLGYDHLARLSWTVDAGFYSPHGDHGDTLSWFADSGAGAQSWAETVLSGLYHGDSLTVLLEVAAPDDSTDVWVSITSGVRVDHGYRVLAITHGYDNEDWQTHISHGLLSRPIPPQGAQGYQGVFDFNATSGAHTADTIYVCTDDTDGIFSFAAMTADRPDTFDSYSVGYQLAATRARQGDLGAIHKALLYWDYKRFLPVNDVTIIDAKVVLSERGGTSGGSNWSSERGLIAMLDTFGNNSAWLSAPTHPLMTHRRAASYDYADFMADPPVAWAQPFDAIGTSQSDLPYYYHYGIGGDFAHVGVNLFTANMDTMMWDVTRQIQYSIDHNTHNNGFWLFWLRDAFSQSAQPLSCGYRHAGLVGPNQHHNPTLWILYREVPHTPAWNGYDLAWNFQTDDQHLTSTVFADSLETHGVRKTFFVRGDTWSNQATDWEDLLDPMPTSGSYRYPAELLPYLQRGHEMASHSRSHGGRAGRHYGAGFVNWGLGSIIADDDSLSWEIDRNWLVTALVDAGFDSTGLDTFQIVRTFAYDNGGFGALANQALAARGYTSGRTTSDWQLDNITSWSMWAGTQGPAWFAAGGAHAATQESNGRQFLMIGQPINLFTQAVYSMGIGSATTYEEVVNLYARALSNAWINNQFPVFTFAHNTSEVPAQNLAWIAQYLTSRGDVWIGQGDDGRYATYGNIIDYYRERASAIEAPGYAPTPMEGVSASDGIYWQGDWRAPARHWPGK